MLVAALGSTVIAATALALLAGTPARAARPALSAYVVATTQGPLPACSQDGSNCGATNTVWDFIHVVNSNPLVNRAGGTDRAHWQNALDVSSIDQQIFVNGVDTFDLTATPPPNASPTFWSSHWPATVLCPGNTTPCDTIVDPGVLPGEDMAVTYLGWIHGNGEPNGTYVFEYTIHGSLNGNPVTLTASSPPIQMTS
jgi:hypothetical protein